MVNHSKKAQALAVFLCVVGGVLILCFPAGMFVWIWRPWGWKMALAGLPFLMAGLYFLQKTDLEG